MILKGDGFETFAHAIPWYFLKVYQSFKKIHQLSFLLTFIK